jgi:hypothetical protein
MRKYLVVCAATMLLCSLVHAQEAEDAGSGAVLSVIPRFDAGMLYDFDAKEASFSFGNTSLYTLFEGNISQNWSFSIANHWVGSDGWAGSAFGDAIATPTSDLYQLHLPLKGEGFNEGNFLDWAYLTFAPGDLSFTLGKQMLLVGGWEFDDYDFDVNPFNASLFWNSFTCYQWGLTAAWDLSESSTLSLQAACSPLNDALSYAAQWDGTYGPYSMKWSALAYPYSRGCNRILNTVFCLGNRLELGDVTLTLDYFNRCGDPNCLVPDIKGHTVNGSVLFAASDEWELGCKVSYNYADDMTPYDMLLTKFEGESFLMAGATATWSPADDISIQTNVGYSDGLGFALLGVKYNFEFNIF